MPVVTQKPNTVYVSKFSPRDVGRVEEQLSVFGDIQVFIVKVQMIAICIRLY